MISVQPFRLFTLLQLAGVSSLVTSTADTTSGRDCSAFTNIPHAFTKRSFNPKLVDPIAQHTPFNPGSGPRGFSGTVLKAEPRASQASTLPDRIMRVDEHSIHRLQHGTFPLEEKELHAGPSNVKILTQIIHRLTLKTKISASQGRASEEEAGFLTRLLEFMVHSFGEEEDTSRCDQLSDVLHSLDRDFLREVQKALDINNPQRTSRTPESLKEAIANSIATVRPEFRLPDGKRDAEALYDIIDKISPGIWRFSLPTKDGRFDLNLLKSNPIAHMSWVLEGLDPKGMMLYAEAFQIPERPTPLRELMHRQMILEQSYMTEPRQKFAGPSWFVQRVGWDAFQNNMLYYELRMDYSKRMRYSLKKVRKSSAPLGRVSKDDSGTKELNSLLKEMGLPVVAEGNDLSSDIIAWLSSFLTWLKDNKVHITQGPRWEAST